MIRIVILLFFAGAIIAGGGVAGYFVAQMHDEAEPPAPQQSPVSYQAGKSDRLASLPFATRLPVIPSGEPQSLDALRRSLAPEIVTEPQDEPLPDVPSLEAAPLPSPRPWGADLQRSYALLSDLQIDAIRERLQLSPAQAKHWPAVEKALRDIARKIQTLKHSSANRGKFTLPQDAPEMQRLKTAAAPLLAQLRDDQKREVRMLARIIGLDAVASRI